MTNANVQKWTPAAVALNATVVKPSTTPVRVQLDEAELLAKFFEHYWEPTPQRPGLKSAAAFIKPELVSDIRSLVDACQCLNAEASFVERDTTYQVQVEHARTVAAELGAALEFVLTDGLTTTSDRALAVMAERAASSNSISQLAETMADFATLARREEPRLRQIADFDVKLIADAESLAKTLLGVARPVGAPASPLIDLRDRMLTLLYPLVAEARRIARFVFRAHPKLQRQVGSAYERERRAARRQQSDDMSTGGATPADA